MPNPKKMVQSQKPKHSKTQSQIFFPAQPAESKQSPIKYCIKRSLLKNPRTCNESPETVRFVKKTDQSSQGNQVIKVKGVVRVSKCKNRVIKAEVKNEPRFIGDDFISPIQKIPLAFVNKEDGSLINALEL